MLKKRKITNISKLRVLKTKTKKAKSVTVLVKKKKTVVKQKAKTIVSKPKKVLTPKKKKLVTKKTKTKLRKKFRRVELICVLTGVVKRFSYKRAQLLATKLNFITVDVLKDNFLSRGACTLLKQGFTEVEIKQKFNFKTDKVLTFDIIKRYIKSFDYKEKMMRKRKRKSVNDLIDLQNSSHKIVAEYKPTPINFNDADHVAYLTKDVCIRPDIHLNGDYSCNFCPHFDLCVCKRKFWNKKISKINDKPNKKFKRL